MRETKILRGWLLLALAGCGPSGALFNGPSGIVSDGAGNLYIADQGAGSVRKLTVATGAVSTVARGFATPLGLAGDGTNLYVCDSGNGAIQKIEIATGAVSMLAGGLAQPSGVVVAGGNLYVADSGNNAVRKIAGGAVTTVAMLDGLPMGIASDGAGNLYVTVVFNDLPNKMQGSTVRKIEIASGAVTTLAGAADAQGSMDGAGADARFYGPEGIATDGAGNLFVADDGNNTIRQIAIATGAVTTLAGMAATWGSADGTGAMARFASPFGVVSDGGALYVTGDDLIRKIVIATAQVTTLAGTSNRGTNDGTPAR
jgi:sugar lactone lactonase YvrE